MKTSPKDYEYWLKRKRRDVSSHLFWVRVKRRNWSPEKAANKEPAEYRGMSGADRSLINALLDEGLAPSEIARKFDVTTKLVEGIKARRCEKAKEAGYE